MLASTNSLANTGHVSDAAGSYKRIGDEKLNEVDEKVVAKKAKPASASYDIQAESMPDTETMSVKSGSGNVNVTTVSISVPTDVFVVFVIHMTSFVS